MQKKTFAVLISVEFLAALIAMGMLFSDVGAVIYPIAGLVFAAVLAPFCIRLRKETDEAKKRNIRRRMALVLLVPIVAAVAVAALVMAALVAYFGL